MRYLNNPDVPVKEFLLSCRICSKALAREKQNSATKDTFVELAIHTSEFMTSMSDAALLHRPYLDKFAYEGENKFPPVLSETKLTKTLSWKHDRESIKKEIALNEFLYTDICENYAKDPFGEINKKKFYDECESRVMTNNGTPEKEVWVADDAVRVKPTFFVSYKYGH